MSTRKKWGNLWIIHVLIFVTQFLRLFKQQLEAKEWEKSLPPAPKQAQGVSTMFNNCSACLLYTSPSPRDATLSRMPSSA